MDFRRQPPAGAVAHITAVSAGKRHGDLELHTASQFNLNERLGDRESSGSHLTRLSEPYRLSEVEGASSSTNSAYMQDGNEEIMDYEKGMYRSPRIDEWVDASTRGAYYFYVRLKDIIHAGTLPYHLFFLSLEFMGVSAFFPYAILLTRGVYPTGSPGLPEAGKEDAYGGDAHSKLLTTESRMHVRVLVPCYKEPLGVIQDTINHALQAALPAGVSRTIYLCDDGKDVNKEAYIRSLGTDSVQYVTGRVRKPAEINGKSANLNNCLKKIFAHLPKNQHGQIDWSEISNKELLVVFDADMCAKHDFFLKILEVMLDDNVALCLTPQAFHNIDPDTDIFNNINMQFWEYWLPGAFAWGYIACTGTNFCLRIRALAHCGWFPEYTITEDYALGMELKARGYKATYLCQYLAVGEAPEEIRNVFRQRSRWTKGHYQVFFSRRNALLNWDLPFFQRLWYSYAAFAPFCTIFTVPGFMIAPFISVLFGIHPLVITYEFVLSSTVYFTIQFVIQNYVRQYKHLKLIWFAQQSNYVLWFTYTKACFNTILAVFGFKNVMFKATDKGKAGDAAPPALPAPPPPPEPAGFTGMVQRLASAAGSRLGTPFKRDGAKETLLKTVSVRNTPARPARPDHPSTPGGRYSRLDEEGPFNPADQPTNSSSVPPLPASTKVKGGAVATPTSIVSRMSRALPHSQAHTPTHHGVGIKEVLLEETKEVELKTKRVVYPMQAPKVPEDKVRVINAPAVGTLPPSPTAASEDSSLYDSPGPSASQVGTARNTFAPVPAPQPGYATVSQSGLKQRTPTAGATDPTFAMTSAEGVQPGSPDAFGTLALPAGAVAHFMAQATLPTAISGKVATALHPRLDSAAASTPAGRAGTSRGPSASGGRDLHAAGGATGNPLYGNQSMASNFLPVPSAFVASQNNGHVDSPGVASGAPMSGDGGSISITGGPVSGPHPVGSGNSWESVANTNAPPSTPATQAWQQNPAYVNPREWGPGHAAPPAGEIGAWNPAATMGVPGLTNIRTGRGGAEPLYPAVPGAPPTVRYPPGPAPPGLAPGAAGAAPAHAHYGPTYVVNNPPSGWAPGGGIPSGYDHPLQRNALMGSTDNLTATSLDDARQKKKLMAGIYGSSDPTPPSQPPRREPPTGELDAKPGRDRLMKVIRSFKPQHVQDFGQMFDPLALIVMWLFNISICCLGLWQLSLVFAQPTVAAFKFNSPVTGNPYLIIAVLWAIQNSVPAYMFIHYCFTSGRSFKFVTKYLPLTSFLGVIAMVILWLMIPSDVPLAGALDLATQSFLPTQRFNDTNTNYLFVSGLNESAISLPLLLARNATAGLPAVDDPAAPATFDPPNLLGGIMAGYDHTKSITSMSFTITWLAWAVVKYGHGFSPRQLASVQTTIKTGADYIMRANLNVNDPTNPVFVAQLGDPRSYTVLPDPGYDPVMQGKSWTAPETDPQLAGNQPRKAWLMTREAIGNDLLANAAAALGAAYSALNKVEPVWSADVLKHAKYLFDFATTNDTAPISYCNFVPCENNVTVRSTVKAQQKDVTDGKPACWYADWDAQLCKVAMTKAECNAIRLKLDDVYKTKSGCCDIMSSTSTWAGDKTIQGLCALPADQWTCYTADLTQRTCYAQSLNLTDGKGCAAGANSKIFGSLLSCCNWLQSSGVIDVDKKPPTGMCARSGTDVQYLTCYIPNIINATCDLETGAACQQFGVITSFDHAVGCCNYLATEGGGGAGNTTLRGVCKPWKEGETRRLAEMGSSTANGDSWWKPRGLGKRGLQEQYDAEPADRHLTSDARLRQLLQDNTAMASRNATANLWPLPDVDKIYTQDPCALIDAPDCVSMTVGLNKTATFYNSTSVLDDMAWAGVWLYRATNDPRYLGAAQRYLARHYVEEVPADALVTDRHIYATDWDNLAWAVNVQLGELTGVDSYLNLVTKMLAVWVFGDTVPSTVTYKPPREEVLLQGPPYESFTLGNVSYNIIPSCIPNKTYEVNCYDGIDDDCNGMTDLEDPRCGLFPVLYTPSRLAFSKPPSLGNAANVAFMALVHADNMKDKMSDASKARLRCWTLSQIGHIVGSGATERSYVVGYGKNYPTRIQHRGSSCPARTSVDDPICNWDSGFRPGTPNPQLGLVLGALVDGPDIHDNLEEFRNSNDMRVSLQSNAGFLSAVVGLEATNTRVRTCESLLGVWQRYVYTQGVLS